MLINSFAKLATLLFSRALYVALSLSLLLHSQGAAAQGMQLMAPGVGWASNGGALYWTSDDGKEWKNTTPPIHRGHRFGFLSG